MLFEQGPPVERAPPAVMGALGEVRDDHVRVEVGVLRAARAVLVGGGNEPTCPLGCASLCSPTRDACLVLEVGDRCLPGLEVRASNFESLLVRAERMQQADALGDAEDEIEAGDGIERLL